MEPQLFMAVIGIDYSPFHSLLSPFLHFYFLGSPPKSITCIPALSQGLLLGESILTGILQHNNKSEQATSPLGKSASIFSVCGWPQLGSSHRRSWAHLYFYFVSSRYNGHTALYKFKVYSMIDLYTSWNDYHSKFSEHPSNTDTKLKKFKFFLPCDNSWDVLNNFH